MLHCECNYYATYIILKIGEAMDTSVADSAVTEPVTEPVAVIKEEPTVTANPDTCQDETPMAEEPTPEAAVSNTETKTEKEEAKPEKKDNTELEKYWKPVRSNPGDFTGWTYLLQYVEQEVSVLQIHALSWPYQDSDSISTTYM